MNADVDLYWFSTLSCMCVFHPKKSGENQRIPHMTMARKSGKLPQWWLDGTPHDTLEDQVERKKKEAAERKEKEEAKKDEHEHAAPSDPPVGLLVDKKSPQSTIQISRIEHKSRRSPTGGNGSIRDGGGTNNYETTDYNEERAKLKHVAAADNGDLGCKSPIRVKDAPGNAAENVKPIGSPEHVEQSVQSPLSEMSSCDTPTRLQARTYKTAFTGAGAFDFAMQQRAQEKERREKERLARESLKQHSANTMEAERVRQQKQNDLEMRRKKQEAQENLKGFKNLALDSKMDKSTELKRQQLEHKRQTKEAEEKHHEYKSTT
jgi:hypothetical protein